MPKPAVRGETDMPKPAVRGETDMPKPAVRGETDMSNPPSRREKRPAGDQRSAEDIFRDNPILNASFMRVIMDSNTDYQFAIITRKGLINQVGDFTDNNRDPISRADAMYRLAHVVHSINNDPGLEREEGYPRESERLTGGVDDLSEINKMAQFSMYGYDVFD